ncbi:MAG: hypothetical protein NTY32_05590, partial [Bacteroidia bacterium]|nr:hypothetical protein [Bacteroidia bacterium]
MSFSPPRFVHSVLLAGLLVIGQSSVSQSFVRQKTPTSYIESSRVASDAFDLPMQSKPGLAGGFAELRVNHL